ncbi:MAG: Xaa-Pro peptidase family protein [Anaerolineae bacterium]|nr:Xaa-Pro peptidase family protein [Anaerolineae bacterium]
MKSDLPRLMKERNLDALVIFGPDGFGLANAPFTYFIGDAHVTTGLVIVKRDQTSDSPAKSDIYLVHSPMEREEAAKTGLQLINKASYQLPEIIRQKSGDRLAAEVELLRRVFNDIGVRGRVGFYGADHVNTAFNFLNALIREGVCDVVAEAENDAISAARVTKDAYEADLIRQTCRLTEAVIGATRDFLRAHRVVHETLVTDDGSPLTVADVKRFIRGQAIALGLDMHDCIFAIGRDAGIPHSSGTPGDPIMVGKTIVFDIFPRGPGGYHADITRTWCLGYAPDHVQQAHELVMQAHALAESTFNTSDFTYTFNEAVCDFFEGHGHPTNRQDYATTRGYMHGLGHGFGLSVHEPPGMSLKGLRPDETFQPGTIVCNEPGLYYPDDPRGGWGVRVEDDYWCNLEGQFERLTSFDRDLVVPM